MIEVELGKVLILINLVMLAIAIIVYCIAVNINSYRKNSIVGIVIGICVMGVSITLISKVTPTSVLNETILDKNVVGVEKYSGYTGNDYRVVYEDGTVDKMIGSIDNTLLTDKENEYEYRVNLVKYYKDIGTVRIINERKRLVIVQIENDENKNEKTD